MYRSALTVNDLISADTVAVKQGVPTKLGEYEIVAGEEKTLGYGFFGGQADADGRLYVDLQDSEVDPGPVDGLLRFEIWDPKNRWLATLGEYRTEALRTNSSDRTKQVAFPYHGDKGVAVEDQKIVAVLIADADKTISKANSTILLDATEFSVRK